MTGAKAPGEEQPSRPSRVPTIAFLVSSRVASTDTPGARHPPQPGGDPLPGFAPRVASRLRPSPAARPQYLLFEEAVATRRAGVLRLLILEQLGTRGDAPAERRSLLAGHVLLAHGAARGRRRVGFAGRELCHRRHALTKGCALLSRNMGLALTRAVTTIGLCLGGETCIRPRLARAGLLVYRVLSARIGGRLSAERERGKDKRERKSRKGELHDLFHRFDCRPTARKVNTPIRHGGLTGDDPPSYRDSSRARPKEPLAGDELRRRLSAALQVAGKRSSVRPRRRACCQSAR